MKYLRKKKHIYNGHDSGNVESIAHKLLQVKVNIFLQSSSPKVLIMSKNDNLNGQSKIDCRAFRREKFQDQQREVKSRTQIFFMVNTREHFAFPKNFSCGCTYVRVHSSMKSLCICVMNGGTSSALIIIIL